MTQSNFAARRKDLKNLSDAELNDLFWGLTDQLVSPLMDLAKKSTTPSIERSVLLRMGFSSIEAKPIVEGVIDQGLMGKGAGHVVYKLSKARNIPIREAGLALAQGDYWDEAAALFAGAKT